jgi:hypothetical protein
LKDPTKFAQIGIFGLKINHLATLFIHMDNCKMFPGVFSAQVFASIETVKINSTFTTDLFSSSVAA